MRASSLDDGPTNDDSWFAGVSFKDDTHAR